jgi:hypothetical protein
LFESIIPKDLIIPSWVLLIVRKSMDYMSIMMSVCIVIKKFVGNRKGKKGYV